MAQTRNVTMRNLRIVSRNWCIGSATFGGVYDVLFEDSTIGNPDMVRLFGVFIARNVGLENIMY